MRELDREPRIAVKFAYDGTRFHGFQRQPDKPTVEGELVRALTEVGAIRSARECGYRSSSRTDRGVSALGNVVSFRTSFPPEQLCSAINSEMEDVWAYSAVIVPDDFNPRFAKQRWYRYLLARNARDRALLEEALSRFVGAHDFSDYARRDERNPVRKIDSIVISDLDIFYAIDFRAESFLWNMVRRIVWVAGECSAGRMPLEEVGPEATKRPARIGLAPPEFLVLMDVDCGIQFPVDPRAAVGISRRLEMRIRRGSARLAFEEALVRALSTGTRP